MFKKPLQTRQWGVIVLTASALSFIGMGGFMIGAILGVIAGVIALTKKENEVTIKKVFSSLEGNVIVSKVSNKKAEVHEL